MTYTISTDNTITAFAAHEDALNHTIGSTEGVFANAKELAKLATGWPISRLVEIWNSFAGEVPFDDLKPVKKFTDRKTAVSRIWDAIQRLEANVAPPAPNVAPKRAKASKEATTNAAVPTAREGSKKAIVIELLKRTNGATIADITAVTSWQAHSVRGFLSGALTKRMGLRIESVKQKDGQRIYRMN